MKLFLIWASFHIFSLSVPLLPLKGFANPKPHPHYPCPIVQITTTAFMPTNTTSTVLILATETDKSTITVLNSLATTLTVTKYESELLTMPATATLTIPSTETFTLNTTATVFGQEITVTEIIGTTTETDIIFIPTTTETCF